MNVPPVNLPRIRNLQLIHEISRGAFGKVYLTVNVQTNKQVAVKVESRKANPLTLQHEAEMYKLLRGISGLPQVQTFGFTEDVNYIVMELVGPTLEVLFHRCHGRFSLQTVLLLADQILQTLEKVHNRNVIHRDLKPANIAMGLGRESNELFVFDFGLATKFRETKTRGHVSKNTECARMFGTPLYASLRCHLHVEPGRRDDLESVGYILVRFLRGNLPWESVMATTRSEAIDAVGQSKLTTPIDVLCKNLPDEFSRYLTYCKDLRFEQTPDYEYLRKLFRKLFEKGKFRDRQFDWQNVN